MFITVISQVLYPSRLVIVLSPYQTFKAGRQVVQWHYHMGRSHTLCEHHTLGGTPHKTLHKYFFFLFLKFILHFLQNTVTTNQVRGCHIRNHDCYIL